MGWFGRMALKYVQYIWNESPVQVRCTMLDACGWCTGTTQRDGMGREEGGGSGWGTHEYLWWIHFDIWQNQYNIVKLKNKIKFKKEKKRQSNQRSNCQHPLDHWKNKRVPKKQHFCFIDYAKAFDCVDHNKLENSERDGNTRPSDLPLEKPVYRSGINS